MAAGSFQTAGSTTIEKSHILRGLDSAPFAERREKLNDMYDQWVTNGQYDEDMIALGYVAPRELADLILQYIPPKSSRLLDCASGTGRLGEELKKRGFLNLDALEPSKASLDYSRSKDVYTNYICEPLGPNRLPIEDDTYDGITMCGAFGQTHVRPDCFPELIRITKPGGYTIFDVIEEDMFRDVCGDGKLDAVLHKLTADGCWEYLLKKRTCFSSAKEQEKPEYCYAFILRVV